MKPPGWVCFDAARRLVALPALGVAVARAAPPSDVLDRVNFVANDAPDAPPASAPWQSVRLGTRASLGSTTQPLAWYDSGVQIDERRVSAGERVLAVVGALSKETSASGTTLSMLLPTG